MDRSTAPQSLAVHPPAAPRVPIPRDFTSGNSPVRTHLLRAAILTRRSSFLVAISHQNGTALALTSTNYENRGADCTTMVYANNGGAAGVVVVP